MSIIKQLATYDGSAWTKDDIGANASNISLSSNIAGSNNVQGALSNLCGASKLTGSSAIVTNSSGVLTASTVTSTELSYLSGATSNIQTQINTLNNNLGSIDISTIGDGTITSAIQALNNKNVQWDNTTDIYWWSNTWTAPADGIIEVEINPSASNWYFYVSDSKALNTGWSHCLSSNSTYRFCASFPVKKGAVLKTAQMQSVNTANVYYTPIIFS